MAVWNEKLVVLNKYSRPGYKLIGVKGIVMHWTADPGATDENEQKFFDGADGGGGRAASAHFFVDRDSATLIVPLNEVAFHANEKPCRIDKLKGSIVRPNGTTYIGGANVTSIGVEMCVEEDGTIHPETINRTADVVAELCRQFNLDPVIDIYRHYDITGKNCPAPWVANSQLFVDFKNRVKLSLTQCAQPAPVQPAPQPQPAPIHPAPVTKQPSGDPTIVKIQKWANSNYGTGIDEDGYFGPQTKRALIRAYQREVGVMADGIFGPKSKAAAKVIRIGSKGMLVNVGQAILYCLGYDPQGIDGVYGRNTANAALRFQIDRRMKPQDAIIGRDTWSELYS